MLGNDQVLLQFSVGHFVGCDLERPFGEGDIEDAKGHAAAALLGDLPEAERRPQRLEAGSKVVKRLLAEVCVTKRSEQPAVNVAIGKGVEEIRVLESSGAYRVIYFARRADAVYVLHAFHKRTQRTPKKDLEIAKRRFGQLLGGRI